MDSILAQLEFDLIGSLALLNLNLTIKENQYPFIVRELVETFPNESLQDFQLCFKNGVRGKYGKIYNVDLSVLAMWMGEYLEEKYQVIETMKPIESEEPIPDVDYQAFKQRRAMEAIRDKEEKQSALVAERERQLKELEYQEERRNYKPDSDKGKEILLKQQWIRECFDPMSAKPTKDWLPFEEWKKSMHR